MGCINHPERAAVTQCSNCQAMLCEECQFSVGKRWTICARCEALLASQDTVADIRREYAEGRQQDENLRRAKERKKQLILALQFTTILTALIVLLVQIPQIYASMQPPPPLRLGTYETNALTDECIAVLWRVAKKLQNGELPGTDLICPASKRPFDILEGPEGDLIAYAPMPELYGFSEIRVSKRHPVPEVIR